ncbi:MAG: D-glycero-beta-D-manno-heptose 1-phosphate adenylyltransferase, partial [Planctomycetota bacterium]
RHDEASPGGAANVACKVAELGGQATLAGVVGRDPEGQSLMERARGLGVETSAVVEDDSRPTTRKIRYIARSQQLLRVDCEDRTPVAGETELELAEAVAGAAGTCDAIIVEDYGKGALSSRVLAAALERGPAVPVIVDPSGAGWSRYRGAAVITPNVLELEAAAGAPARTDAELEAAARKLLAESGVRAIAVTRGPEGITLVTPEALETVPTTPAEVYDVTGAGDAVAAAFALALAGGLSLLEGCAVANLAGGAIVRQMGVGRLSREMLIGAAAGRAGSAARKVVPPEEAAREARRLQAAGARVVFTNGCFDILHPGHVYLLEEARKAGDFLIVGLNSDESVRRIKGEGRPAQTETRRAQVLAALETVDLVIVFDEDTPRNLIEQLRPDVLVKGGEYEEAQIVGAKFVRSYGGEVVRVPLTDDGGTSDVIARIKTDDVSVEAERREWRDE